MHRIIYDHYTCMPIHIQWDLSPYCALSEIIIETFVMCAYEQCAGRHYEFIVDSIGCKEIWPYLLIDSTQSLIYNGKSYGIFSRVANAYSYRTCHTTDPSNGHPRLIRLNFNHL